MAEDYKELESLETPKGVYNSFPDKLARNELKGKVPVPDKPVEGYYLKIKAVNGDGTFTVEAVPAPTGGGELPATAKFETLAIGADEAEGVYIQSDGTAEAPALVLYGEHGDEAVRLMNLARAVDDSDAPNLAQVREMVGNGSGENLSGTDVSIVKTILGNIMTIIKAQVEDERGTPQGYNINVSGLFAQNDALISALGGSGDSGGETPEKILISISAVYSGGPVPAGTALDELVGVVVTAHYGDGSSAAVTDYTLSGVIAEGSNTIVASYGGMTATFEVVGTGSTVYLKDVAQFDQFIVRKALTQNNEAGAWSVEVPYSEGMTVSGCIQPSWKNSYGIAVITAPDDTQSTSFDYDTEGVRLVDGGTPVQQYTAVLAGFTEGSTVRINMFMGSSVTTEELARAFATTHKDYLYYEPGEV